MQVGERCQTLPELEQVEDCRTSLEAIPWRLQSPGRFSNILKEPSRMRGWDSL